MTEPTGNHALIGVLAMRLPLVLLRPEARGDQRRDALRRRARRQGAREGAVACAEVDGDGGDAPADVGRDVQQLVLVVLDGAVEHEVIRACARLRRFTIEQSYILVSRRGKRMMNRYEALLFLIEL